MHTLFRPFVLLALAAMPAFSQQPQQRRNLRPTTRPAPQVESWVGTGNDIVTHIADGGGWRTWITLMNLSETKAAAFTLNFYGDDGKLLTLSFEQIGTGSSVTGTIGVGGSLVIKTSGGGAGTQGWAQFDYSSTTDFIGGFAIFINDNGNEAAVPFESSISQNSILSFDNTGGYGMGVALANSDFVPMTITATFRDSSGNLLGTRQFSMDPMTHTAFIFSDQWPFTAGKQGTVHFECTDKYGPNAFGLAILGLRFTPRGTLTSVTAFEKWRL